MISRLFHRFGFPAAIVLLLAGPMLGVIAYRITSGFGDNVAIVLGVVLFLIWAGLGVLLLLLANRRRVHASLEHNRLFLSVCRSLTEGVVVADDSGKFLHFNDAAERMLGIGAVDASPAEWSGVYGCFFPDTKQPYPADQLPLARAIRGEETKEVEIFIRNPNCPDGIWVSITGAPLLDERDRPRGGVIAFHDVSDRKRAEHELRESMKELEDTKYALDQAAIVAATDTKGNILFANDKLCEISGYSREELLGEHYRVLNSGTHSESFFRDLWTTISSGGTWRGEIRDRKKDGSCYWVDTTIVPFLDESGKPQRFIAIQYDISDRRSSEEVRQRLSNAVEQTDDTVFITDRKGRIEYVNPAFERTTGYSKGEALGQTPRILKSGVYDAEHYEKLWKTILKGDVYRNTTINRKKSGETYYAEQTITPIRDSDGHLTHFVSVVKDMTERRKRQAQEIEIEVAARIQEKLYPHALPQSSGLDIAGAAFPATATCGDYFDYFAMPDGTIGIAIGDVTGHGVGPALIMAETRAYLRSLAQADLDPSRILTRLNELLNSDLTDGNFVTLALAQIDARAGRMLYANAGHPSALVFDRSGALKASLESTGMPLGLLSDTKLPTNEERLLEPGDTVVFVTDGIMECQASDGKYFELDGVMDTVTAHIDEPARQIVNCIREATGRFSNGCPQEDDMTIVVCKLADAE